MQIDTLKSMFDSRGGIMRANRFRVMITPPFSYPQLDGPSLNILCDSVTLPGFNIETAETTQMKNKFKIPAGIAFSEVPMSFILTNDFIVRGFFEVWRARMVDPNTYRVGYEADYNGTVDISALDSNNTELFRLQLFKAFPISVTDTPLGNDKSGTTLLEATFTFREYTIEK